MENYSDKEYWRLLILYGQNVSTYKMALARCLYDFTREGRTDISMTDLAKAFFDLYNTRLENGLPQLNSQARSAKMKQRYYPKHQSEKIYFLLALLCFLRYEDHYSTEIN